MRLFFALAFGALSLALTFASCGGMKCDSTTCTTGCCDAKGQCRTSSTTLECGTFGATCVACAAGTQCQLGTCTFVSSGTGGSGGGSSGTGGGSAGTGGGSAGTGGGTSSRCTSDNCSGCCTSEGTCQSGNSINACGRGANACVVCLSGQSCTVGLCSGSGTGGGGGTTTCTGFGEPWTECGYGKTCGETQCFGLVDDTCSEVSTARDPGTNQARTPFNASTSSGVVIYTAFQSTNSLANCTNGALGLDATIGASRNTSLPTAATALPAFGIHAFGLTTDLRPYLSGTNGTYVVSGTGKSAQIHVEFCPPLSLAGSTVAFSFTGGNAKCVTFGAQP